MLCLETLTARHSVHTIFSGFLFVYLNAVHIYHGDLGKNFNITPKRVKLCVFHQLATIHCSWQLYTIHGNYTLFMATIHYSWQLYTAHGNYMLFMATIHCSWQLYTAHGNYTLLLTVVLMSVFKSLFVLCSIFMKGSIFQYDNVIVFPKLL